MFGGLQGFVPDSDEPEGDDFQVVYGDAREEAAAAGHAEDAPAARVSVPGGIRPAANSDLSA